MAEIQTIILVRITEGRFFMKPYTSHINVLTTTIVKEVTDMSLTDLDLHVLKI